MRRAKLQILSAIAAVLWAAAVSGAEDSEQQWRRSADAETASVEEMPRRPMTVKSAAAYPPQRTDPFPFKGAEPFVVDPATAQQHHGAIGAFNTVKPPSPLASSSNRGADDYYDYDKLEEVPYDYRGDPIDRKDVRPEPGSARPNDIAKPADKPVKSQTPVDIYQFLNLPKQYVSSDFKYPLVSSSYANTKVQGSGGGSGGGSSLSNHKMPASPPTVGPAAGTTTAAATASWYGPAKTTAKPTTTTAAVTRPPATTTTTTGAPASQEYEEYDYGDYNNYRPQEPALSSTTTTTTTAAAAATTTTTTTSTTTAKPLPTSTTVAAIDRNRPPSPPSVITPEPAAVASTTAAPTVAFTDADAAPSSSAAHDRTTTVRPEIDLKLDGTSFADYDAIPAKPATGDKHQQQHRQPEYGGQRFKPLPGDYQFDDKTYPLISNGKVPMTFTAHVSSGISLNQKEHRPPASEPTQQQYNAPSNGRPAPQQPEQPSKSRPPADPFETDGYYQVRPNAAAAPPQFPGGSVQNRPAANPNGRPSPYRPAAEPPVVFPQKTSEQDTATRRPAVEPQQQKNKPAQYAGGPPPPPNPVDTSKFKPPKHVINHFIKTLPDEDNKSYALQTSFSIGMLDGGAETGAAPRPGQGVGQVLVVKDSSSAEDQQQHYTLPPAVHKSSKPTTSVPLIVPPPSRPVLQQQQQKQQPPGYPRPLQQWAEKSPPPPPYYSATPKRDGPPLPPQRSGLPNILPQFRPNAKVDGPIAAPLPSPSHSATIERVQIPMDHLRPPPLPKPQFLQRVQDRNDDSAVDDETPDVPEKETRILQRTGPQPAKVTTLQMIQHGPPVGRIEDPAYGKENPRQQHPVHVVYAANSPPPRQAADIDPVAMLAAMDSKDRSADVPVLKTKTTAVNRPATATKTAADFPYRIVRPEDNRTAPPPPSSSFEYQAYSPTRPEPVRPNHHDHELVPNLQDYVPVATRDPSPQQVAPQQQKPIAATLKTGAEDNHKPAADDGHKPALQNFQIPFQPSLKLPENGANGWSVVRKSPQPDNASERMDEANGDAAGASTEKFDPDNFKPQLVGGFVPIDSPQEQAKDKRAAEPSERA